MGNMIARLPDINLQDHLICFTKVFSSTPLFSFSIMNQLRISQLEVATKVPVKFRYPFFVQMHWFVLERYVAMCTGKERE